MAFINIESVTCWRTTDGVLFEDQDKAYAHQTLVETEARVAAFVEKYYSECNEPVQGHIAEMLIKHGHELVGAFEKNHSEEVAEPCALF